MSVCVGTLLRVSLIVTQSRSTQNVRACGVSHPRKLLRVSIDRAYIGQHTSCASLRSDETMAHSFAERGTAVIFGLVHCREYGSREALRLVVCFLCLVCVLARLLSFVLLALVTELGCRLLAWCCVRTHLASAPAPVAFDILVMDWRTVRLQSTWEE